MPTQRIRGALARDAAIDGMLMLGPGGAAPALAALRDADRLGRIAVGTFDLTPEVLAAVRDGQILFAIDQQPYLQGYLAVVLLTKYLETKAMPGGGEIIRTGPSFVTKENAADVIALAERGFGEAPGAARGGGRGRRPCWSGWCSQQSPDHPSGAWRGRPRSSTPQRRSGSSPWPSRCS